MTKSAAIETRIVGNPYFDPAHPDSRANPSEIRVDVNTRESSIATMHARRQIDDKQKIAADRFRALYEAAGYVGAQALDYSLEVVDGGPAPSDGLYQRRVDAVGELSVISAKLGEKGYKIVIHICGQGCTIAEATAIVLRKQPSKADREHYGRIFREHLDLLCEYWGYSKRAT